MITVLLTFLFSAIALVSMCCLADSLVRGRNAWRLAKAELAELDYSVAPVPSAQIITFQNIRTVRSAQYGVDRALAA